MKLAFLIACIPVAACTPAPAQKEDVEIANPASEHCVELGGRLVMGGTDGQTGYCHLPNGRVVEEWALFREAQAQPSK